MISIKSLHKQEGGTCYYCGCKTKMPKKNKNGSFIINPRNSSREHLVPKSEGGTDNRINIKLACYECNALRGTMHAVTWKIIASNPRTRRGYIKMRNHLKHLKKMEKKELQKQRRAQEIVEKACGIIVRHHTWGREYFESVFGEQYATVTN